MKKIVVLAVFVVGVLFMGCEPVEVDEEMLEEDMQMEQEL